MNGTVSIAKLAAADHHSRPQQSLSLAAALAKTQHEPQSLTIGHGAFLLRADTQYVILLPCAQSAFSKGDWAH